MLKGILWIVFIFGSLVFFHELGHFLMAKFLGIVVEEFSLGFGLPIMSFRWGETSYSIRLVPLGGYVKLKGEEPREDIADDPDNFYNQPYWKRFLVISFGPLSNYLISFLFLFTVFSFVRTFVVVDKIVPGSVAEQVGLKPGDVILRIDSLEVRDAPQIVNYISRCRDKQVKISVMRDGKMLNFTAKPRWDEEKGRAYLGIYLRAKTVFRHPDLLKGLTQAGEYIYTITVRYTSFLIGIFTSREKLREAANRTVGPIGIGKIIWDFSTTSGIYTLITLTAFLSAAIGYINLVPFPALDGGRLLMLIIAFIAERIFRVKWDPKKEEMIHTVGFVLLLVLLVVVSIKDVHVLLFEGGKFIK